MPNINLGDRVKDKVTSFEGIVVSITNYLQGCKRIAVQAEHLGQDGKPIEASWFDEPQVVLVKTNAIDTDKKRKNGGVAYLIDPGR